MNDLVAIAYVSSAVRMLDEPALEALLAQARAHNARHRVTGVLLYDDGSFFQYIEGPAAGIEAVYARILGARLHEGLIELFRRPVAQRGFQTWDMGFSHAPRSLVLALAQASWERVVAAQAALTDPGSGARLLLEFWDKASRRRPSAAAMPRAG